MKIEKYKGQLPFYRVDSRSPIRSGYSDNTSSVSFTEEAEAIEFASGLKGQIREVLFIHGKTKHSWKYKILAKWGKKKSEITGRLVIGRIK